MADPDRFAYRLQEGESVGRALELLGERWTLLILREAFFGVRRFGQLARNFNIPRPTLSSRLRTLVEAGLLERVLYARDPDPPRVSAHRRWTRPLPVHRRPHALGRHPLRGPERPPDRAAPPPVRRDRR